jgi:hypothetical protein
VFDLDQVPVVVVANFQAVVVSGREGEMSAQIVETSYLIIFAVRFAGELAEERVAI